MGKATLLTIDQRWNRWERWHGGIGQTLSVHTLPMFIQERAVGAFANLWYSPAEYP